MRLALVLSYEGTGFAGWQSQAGLRTVQGVLEEALARPCRRRVVTHGAGRTDAGVHAAGQVAHADVPERWESEVEGLHDRLDSLLPDDLRAIALVPVGRDFHARRSALGKLYRYRLRVARRDDPLTRRHRLHVPHALDLDAMRRACELVVGERDFASLRTSGSSVRTTRRRIDACRVTGSPPGVDLEIRGSGFLRHMVRALVGSLLEVGQGRRPPDWIEQVLEARDRAVAGPNAPARGLVLESVAYGPPHAAALAEGVERQSAPRSPVRSGTLAGRAAPGARAGGGESHEKTEESE